MIKIYNKYGGVLKEVDANTLSGANLSRANLYGADLYGANLSRANLSRANLSDADLYGTNLYGADLYGANLSDVKEIVKEITTPMYSLIDQETIRLYKLVTSNNTGPWYAGITYEIGKEYSIEQCNEDIKEQCGAGINVATLDWCLKEYKPGYKILIVEFKPEDIAAIPIGSDGKIRVKRCKVIAEKDITGMV